MTALGFASTAPARAGPVTFEFAGIIDQVDDPTNILGGAVRVGDPFSGRYTFDPATPDSQPHPDRGDYDGSVLTISGMIASLAFENMPESFGLIRVDNSPPPFSDSYLVASEDGIAFAGATFGVIMFLGSSDGSVFTNDSLPLTPPSLLEFGVRQFSLVDRSEIIPLILEGAVTQLVPEPATVTILIVAAGFLIQLRRRTHGKRGRLAPTRIRNWNFFVLVLLALVSFSLDPKVTKAADCNNNGLDDATELGACRVELVFIFDTSTSMQEELGPICDDVNNLVLDLSDEFLPGNLPVEKLRINAGGIACPCCTGGLGRGGFGAARRAG